MDVDTTSSRRRPALGEGSSKCGRTGQPALFGREQIDAPAREEARRGLADPVPDCAVEVRGATERPAVVVRVLAEVHLAELRLELQLGRGHMRVVRRGARRRV